MGTEKKECCGNCKVGKTCVSDIKANVPDINKVVADKLKKISNGKIIKK